MREILFKAKRKDNGEWVEGLLWKKKYKSNKWYISCFPDKDDNEEVYAIDENTLCQYTGLTDKNGKKIWEGDIVKIYEDIDYRICDIKKPNRKTRTIIGVVVFDEKRFEYKIKNEEYNLTLFRLSKKDTNEVLGNIFDNPELMKGEEHDT